jgi:DNA invertase Pin-like site-specific DNA recombinase
LYNYEGGTGGTALNIDRQNQAENRPPLNYQRGAEAPELPDPAKPMTVDALITYCVSLEPERASTEKCSDYCVTPLINQLIVDGEIVSLRLQENRWGALYVRVSDEAQRSRRSGKKIADGFSEEEQLNRGIRYFIAQGFAFKIYSDCGISGDFPIDDPVLVHRLLQKRASRYRKIYTRTLMDDTSLLHRTPQEIESMRAFIDRQCNRIMQGTLTENDFYESDELGVRQARRLRSGGRKRVLHRQAYTQLWRDVETDRIHLIAASDRSRINRDADIETEFLQLLAKHETRLFGLIEDMSALDVSDPLRKGTTYLLASVNEFRLEELAGHCFRGRIQALQQGQTGGKLPWWLERARDGSIRIIPGCDNLARRIVDMYLAGRGYTAIANTLRNEGLRIKGKRLTHRQINYMLDSDALCGLQWQYGLSWKIFPPILDKDVLDDLRCKRALRAEALKDLHQTANWADHLFTGFLYCRCGARLIYNAPRKEQTARGQGGYYRCLTRIEHPGDEDQEQTHSSLSEDSLRDFLNDILRHNPNILNGLLASQLGDSMKGEVARRALLQERLKKAEQEFENEQRIAQEQAATMVTTMMGIRTGAPGFADAVQGVCAGLLGEKRAELEALTQEINTLSGRISDERQKQRLLATLDELRGWDSLDTISQNRLLRSIFERIDVYPMHQGGYIILKLNGIETPLPPAKMRRWKANQISLPTAREWLNEMLKFASDPEWHLKPEPKLNSKTMRPFNRFLSSVKREESAVGQLAAQLLADPEFPDRVYYKPRVHEFMRRRNIPFDPDVLDTAWDRYLEMQRQRATAMADENEDAWSGSSVIK